MADKVDLRRTLDAYSARRGQLRVVDVPDLQYLALDGHGDPNTSPAFAEAVSSLYPVAYRLKFASKADLGRDYVVPPLEGLWWAEDMELFTSARDKARWSWILLILVPGWLDQAMVDRAVEQCGAKDPPPRLQDVRLRSLSEGRCVQTLHVGSFDDEAEVLARLHAYVAENGFALAGLHHEVYLSDLRRVAPERQRTILRQPVRPS